MTLRKLSRNPAKLEALDLFRRLDSTSTTASVSLSHPNRLDEFIGKIRAGLTEAFSEESTIYGWHTQSLFAAIVVALDKCQLIMSIDHGDVYAEGDIKPADYLVVLEDGTRLSIDVKSIAPAKGMDKISLSAAEFDGLVRFAELIGARPYTATRFKATDVWMLNSAEDYTKGATGRMVLDSQEAFKRSEMSLLGDYMFEIEPELRLDIFPDVDKTKRIDSDSFDFTIGGLNLFVGGRQLTEPQARRIAWFLMLYGDWEESDEVKMAGDSILAVSFRFSPLEHETSAKGPVLVGPLSTLYSRLFEGRTSDDSGITALGIEPEPGMLASLIPSDYSSEELPLRRFVILPNRGEAP